MLVLAMALGLSYGLMAANTETAEENVQPAVTTVAADSAATQTLQADTIPSEESEAVANNGTEDEADDSQSSMLEDVSDSLVEILGVLLIFGGPVAIIVLCLVYRYKLRKHRLELAEKALAAGKELPAGILDPVTERPAERWIQKGIINLFAGLGVSIALYALAQPETTTIGILIMCFGAGQLLTGIVKRKYIKQDAQGTKPSVEVKEPRTDDNASTNGND